MTVNIQYDIILKDNHIVLLTIFHHIAVKLAHVGHPGVQKNKSFDEKQSIFCRHG